MASQDVGHLSLLSLLALKPGIVGAQEVLYPWEQHESNLIVVAFYPQGRGSAIALGIHIAVFATPGFETPGNGLQVARVHPQLLETYIALLIAGPKDKPVVTVLVLLREPLKKLLLLRRQ